MDNDKLFATYALVLVAVVTSTLVACVNAGVGTVPTAGVFIEHVAMSFGFRAAYKSLGGFEWLHSAAEFVGWITSEEGAIPPNSGAAAMG